MNLTEKKNDNSCANLGPSMEMKVPDWYIEGMRYVETGKQVTLSNDNDRRKAKISSECQVGSIEEQIYTWK